MPLQYFEKWVHTCHTDSIDCVAFSEDGVFLASGSMDGTVTKIQTLCFRAHSYPIEHLAFDHSGLKLATGAQQELKVWRYLSPGCLLVTYLYQGITFRGHADLSPDETRIAIFNQHNGVDVYKIPGAIWLKSYRFKI
ncbi:hypothetical protein P692DRAFT_201685192, partial [Suillus brevipes Sb2]